MVVHVLPHGFGVMNRAVVQEQVDMLPIGVEILQKPLHELQELAAALLGRDHGRQQRAILAGDDKTGITIMQMDEGLDTGDMLLKLECNIDDNDTAGSLHDRLAVLGAQAIVDTVEQLESGQLRPQSQDEQQACYAAKLDKAEALLDWHKTAVELDRQVHAFNPWPVAQTRWRDDVLRIWESSVVEQSARQSPGKVIQAGKQGIDVGGGRGSRYCQSEPLVFRILNQLSNAWTQFHVTARDHLCVRPGLVRV